MNENEGTGTTQLHRSFVSKKGALDCSYKGNQNNQNNGYSLDEV